MTEQSVKQTTGFAIGDQVLVTEMKFSGADQLIIATIVEVRHILGKQTYVIETEQGKRRVVGNNQVHRP